LTTHLENLLYLVSVECFISNWIFYISYLGRSSPESWKIFEGPIFSCSYL